MREDGGWALTTTLGRKLLLLSQTPLFASAIPFPLSPLFFLFRSLSLSLVA